MPYYDSDPDREDEAYYRRLQHRYNAIHRAWANHNCLDPRDPDWAGPEDEPEPPEELA
jgi:hypothetical protein